MNVFERALEIVEDHGWYRASWHGPGGERCLMQAYHEAVAELCPLPRASWWRKCLPVPWWWRDPPQAAVEAYRAEADARFVALRAAIQVVSGEEPRTTVSAWNDGPATSEDEVRLVLQVAARSLDEMPHACAGLCSRHRDALSHEYGVIVARCGQQHDDALARAFGVAVELGLGEGFWRQVQRNDQGADRVSTASDTDSLPGR